jgi:hypothetical protein
MRKEPFGVGDYVHVIKRGARGMHLVRDESDRWRFLLLLRHCNDSRSLQENWYRELMDLKMANTLDRPPKWPIQKPLTKVLSYRLMDNHFHLLLKEVVENGIAKFMQKVCSGMSNHFNAKYNEKGSLFQGAYKAKTIKDDDYLKCVSAYIQVKNSFELYSGGYDKAVQEFEKAYEWSVSDPYCSLGCYADDRESPIIEKEILGEIFEGGKEFNSFAKEYILSRNDQLRLENFEDEFE